MNKNLVDIDHIMEICDNAVFPFVVELSISERSAKQFQKFVHVSSATVSSIRDESATSHTLSKKIIFYEIRQDFHDWAWSCLKNGNVGTLPDMDISHPVNVPCSMYSERKIVPKKTRCGRTVKKPKVFE